MQPSFQERRREPRRRSLLGATLRVAPGMSASECVVRDIHSGGARLLISYAIPLTDTFELTIGPRRDIRRARLAWRRADAVGVAFVRRQPPAEVVPLNLMRALRAERTENDALRGRLAELRRRIGAAQA